jgi:membrane protease YdiL (CAAX protease family)
MDLSPTVPQPETTSPVVSHTPVAPAWHTVVLILVLILFSALGARSGHPVATNHGRIPQYIVQMIWEWLVFAYVLFGFRLSHIRLREVIGGRWESVEDVLLDIALAFGFWIAALISLSALGYALHLTGTTDVGNKIEDIRKQIGFLAPRTNVELGVFVVLSVTAGFVEEIVFRGYFQRQFSALSRNVWIGAIVSALLFGSAHGYEGAKRMLLIAIFGMMFSTLTILRKSLRPGMMAHALHDSITGLFLRFLLK